MNTAAKLAAFAAVVAVGFGAGAGVGAAVGPIDVGTETPSHHTHPANGASMDPQSDEP